MQKTTVMYETAADLDREQATIERFLRRYPGATARKLGREFHADFAVVNRVGKTILYVEVKQRFCSVKDHPTYWVGESRLTRLERTAQRDGVTPLLLVEWTDAIGYVHPTAALDAATIKVGGRRDRGDERDIERMASFPFEVFTFIDG